MTETNSTLIRSESPAAVRPTPFNFEDVRQMAMRILRMANEQAQRKLMAAEKQAQDLEVAGYDDGMKKGYAEGLKKGEAEGRAKGEAEARAEFSQATVGVIPMVNEIVGTLDAAKISLLAQAEADLLSLAMAVARRIVRQELQTRPEAILPILRDAITLTSHRNDITFRVAPQDLAAVEQEMPALRQSFTDLGRVHVDVDTSIEPGGVIVVTQDGEVDMRIETQFAALDRALMGQIDTGEEG